MRPSISLATALAALVPLAISPSLASAVPHAHGGRDHRADARRSTEHRLAKRDYNGRATYYSTGLGACGWYNSDSDFIVALNQPMFEQGGWCGKKITITYGGKSTQATISDEFPGCPFGGLDMSPGLFSYFASKDVGVFYMSWSLAGQGDSQPSTTQQKSTSTSQWTPTTTWSPEPKTTWSPTTTWTPTTTWSSYPAWSSSSARSQSASSSSSSSSWSSSANSSSWSSTRSWSSAAASFSASASAAVGPIGVQPNANGLEPAGAYATGGNLDTLNQALIGLGALAIGSAKLAIQQS